MKKDVIFAIIPALFVVGILTKTVFWVDIRQPDVNEQSFETEVYSDAAVSEHESPDESEESIEVLTDEDFLKLIGNYVQTGEINQSAEENIKYFRMNSDGTGVCIFDIFQADMFSTLAVTKDNGIIWRVVDESFRIPAGSVSDGNHSLAYINNTLMIFAFDPDSSRTEIKLVLTETGEEKTLYVSDVFPDLEGRDEGVFATVLDQTDDSVMVAWTCNNDSVNADDQSTFCIAQYDSAMEEIKQVYKIQ